MTLSSRIAELRSACAVEAIAREEIITCAVELLWIERHPAVGTASDARAEQASAGLVMAARRLVMAANVADDFRDAMNAGDGA